MKFAHGEAGRRGAGEHDCVKERPPQELRMALFHTVVFIGPSGVPPRARLRARDAPPDDIYQPSCFPLVLHSFL